MQEEREEEEYDMCQALREWIEEEREEGREEGREECVCVLVEICKELGASKGVATSKIVQKYGLSDKIAKQKVEKYWK